MASSTEASPFATPVSVSRVSSCETHSVVHAGGVGLEGGSPLRDSPGSVAHPLAGLFALSARQSKRRTHLPHLSAPTTLVEQPPPVHLIPNQTKEEEIQQQRREQLAAAQKHDDAPSMPPPRSYSSDDDDDDHDDDDASGSDSDASPAHSSVSAAAAAAAAAIAAVSMAASETPTSAASATEVSDELRNLRSAAVRIQSLYRGASLRRVLGDPNAPMPQVNQSRRECWRINHVRKRAIDAERPVAQTMPSPCVQTVLDFLSFGEVARIITVTCREWLSAARTPNQRQATLAMVTHASLHRMWHSTLLSHVGSLHTSLRVCVSPLALNFDLFQSYFDLQPSELCAISEKFPSLTELVTCIKVDSIGTLVPVSPQGIHGHLYGGRTGQTIGTGGTRRLLCHPSAVDVGDGAGPSAALAPVSPLPPMDDFRLVFPPLLKVAVLELGLPIPAATKAILALSSLGHLENLTLLAISELDLAPLVNMPSLRSLSIRYSNLSGKTTRLRFPRQAQYGVLRQLSQLRELEVEEGFLVEPVHPHAQTQSGGVGSFLHELLLGEEGGLLPDLALAPPTAAAAAMPLKIVHNFRLRHLHMEKTTLVRGNEPALLTLPTLTSLTPFRFSYDCNFSFLRALPNLTQLHLHFSTSASPPPPMLPLMSHLLTCRSLTELSFRGVAFGASEQLLLLTFLSSVRLHKFRLMFCTLPSLRCIQTLAPNLRSFTLDSCVCLGVDPHNPGMHAPHVLFPYGDVITYLQKMPRLTELYLNGTFEPLPYATLQLLTYPSQFFPALKKLVLTQGSVMLSSYDHRRSKAREEVTLELEPPPGPDDDEDGPRPQLMTPTRHSRRHSARPGFNPPGLRR